MRSDVTEVTFAMGHTAPAPAGQCTRRASAMRERVVTRHISLCKSHVQRWRGRTALPAAALSTLLTLSACAAISAPAQPPTLHALGPYDATFLAGGIGLKR